MITRTKRNDIIVVEYEFEGMARTVRVSQDPDDGFIAFEPPFFHESVAEEVVDAIRLAKGVEVP